jgi:sensor histidine kinase YesM
MRVGLLNRVVISILISLLFKIIFFKLQHVIEFDLIPLSFATYIIIEGNLSIDRWLNRKVAWHNSPKKRLILQSTAFTLFTSIAIFLVLFFLHQIRFGDGKLFNRRMVELFFPTLIFSLALITIYISFNFFNAWTRSLLEIEKFKTESVEAQLQNLKSQINPHFLFNNLSVLTSLVYKNQNKAVDFINELSKVYRYVLENKNTELVSLQEELDFLKHYIYLLEIRFENAVNFSIRIDEDCNIRYLPPMCLQMLVENAIQHNEASQARTLFISIYTDNDSIVIKNNIQARIERVQSSKTGLKNIQVRYRYFTENKVEIVNNGEFFKVNLPLILK